MAKYGLLCLMTLFVTYQIEAKSGIIEIAEDLENEIFHIDHYNKELFNMIQPSVHPSKKPGYCKYCKFCKYCPCDNDPNCKYCKYCWMCNVFCLIDKSQKWDGPIFQTPQITIVM